MKNIFEGLDKAGFTVFIIGLVCLLAPDLPTLVATIEKQAGIWVLLGFVMNFTGFVMKKRL